MMMLSAGNIFTTRTVLILLVLLLAFLLFNLGSWGVIETSEARYAEISREMLLSGDWLHPRLLGIQHFHKPPVTYIISAFGMKLFGANAFGARFFLQISLVLQALLVYLIGLNLFKEKRPAIIALIVYITIPAVLVSARNLTTDSFLTNFELAAIWCWLEYKKAFRVSWLYSFYLLLALAFLTKGPVGLIFPVLVCIVYRSENKPSASKKLHHFSGLLLLLLFGLSWYVYLMLQDKQFVDYFILKHTVQRVANAQTFGRSKPWWFYLVLVPVLSLPWSAFLIIQYKKVKQLPQRHLRLFLLWIFVPLVFFSLSSSKLILYVLPLFAGMALLTGKLLNDFPDEKLKKTANFTVVFFLVLAIALLLLQFLPLQISAPTWTTIFPLSIFAGIIFLWQKPMLHLYKILGTALLFTLILIPFSTFLLAENPVLTKSGKLLANFIKTKKLENRKIIVYDELLPSLAFHLQKDIISVYDKDKDLLRETQFETDENWRQTLLNIHTKADEIGLQELVKQQPVLLVKGEIPSEQRWLLQHFPHNRQFGKWRVYY